MLIWKGTKTSQSAWICFSFEFLDVILRVDSSFPELQMVTGILIGCLRDSEALEKFRGPAIGEIGQAVLCEAM